MLLCYFKHLEILNAKHALNCREWKSHPRPLGLAVSHQTNMPII